MRREQRENWRKEINDEIPPSFLIEKITGDSDATSREKNAPTFRGNPPGVTFSADFNPVRLFGRE
jgi:hypothetical protein